MCCLPDVYIYFLRVGEIFNISRKGREPYMGRPSILLGDLITP